MNFFTTVKATFAVMFGAFLIQTAFQNPAFGQGGGNNSQGLSGSEIQGSEITSKMSEMPRFNGFERLEKTTYIGGTSAYFPPRMSTGQRLSSGQQASSGNTRTATTGSRTTGSAATMRNRNTTNMMGNMGRMGGVGGTNTNTVRSVTSLGYSLSETAETARPSEAVRISQIENRINNNSRITVIVPVTVEMENSTAILRGTVKNEHERKLLEQLVKLEPGIHRVQNELTLAGENR